MVRVPLPFRGVAVLLLAASTVVGQTPEPPAELLPLDSVAPTTPNFLREFSADPRHPLLALMVDGELSSLEPAQAQDSSKLKPQAKSSSPAPKTDSSEGIIVDDGQLGGQFGGGQYEGGLLGGGQYEGGLLGGNQLEGGLLGGGQSGGGLLGGGLGGGQFGGGLGGGMCGGCGLETMGPSVPNMLSFACAPPPCCCRKCQRRCGHKHGGGCGYGGGCGNAYLNWPSCPPCFYCSPCNAGCGRHRCGHRQCGGCGNYGYGGGWGMECGCCMPPPCCGHKCHRRHNRCGGCAAYGYPCGGGWDMGCGGGGWDMGYGGGWGMDCGCWMAPPCCGHKCHRRHGCSNCCYGGYGYSGWEGCGYGYGCGCGRRHGGRCHRGCQQMCCYPMMMPCMETMPCMGMWSGMGMGSGMGMMSGMGCESFGGGGMLAGGCGCDGTLGGMGY